MKKALGIFLFICLTAPIWFTYSWLTISKQEIRREIKRKIITGMAKANIVLLAFTKKEAQEKLRWEKAGEFEYKGKMYDVIDKETVADVILFRCVWDQKETHLNTQAKDLMEKALGQNPQQKETQKRLISFFQSLFFPGHFSWNPDGPNRDHKFYPDNRFLYLSLTFEPPVPPPRIS